MNIILDILAVVGGLGIILISWETYHEAKLDKAWNKAYEAEFIQKTNGRSNSYKVESKAKLKAKKVATKAKISKPAQKASRPSVVKVRSTKG